MTGFIQEVTISSSRIDSNIRRLWWMSEEFCRGGEKKEWKKKRTILSMPGRTVRSPSRVIYWSAYKMRRLMICTAMATNKLICSSVRRFRRFLCNTGRDVQVVMCDIPGGAYTHVQGGEGGGSTQKISPNISFLSITDQRSSSISQEGYIRADPIHANAINALDFAWRQSSSRKICHKQSRPSLSCYNPLKKVSNNSLTVFPTWQKLIWYNTWSTWR